MKKVLLIACLAISLSGYSRNIVDSWECDNTKIIMYDDNTCDVGELTYQVVEKHGKIFLSFNNKVMLFGSVTKHGTLLMYKSNNSSDKEYSVNSK